MCVICEGKKNNLSNICVGKYIVCKQIPGSPVSLRLMTDKWERQSSDYTHTLDIYTHYLDIYTHYLHFTHISLFTRYRNIHYKYTLDTLWDVHLLKLHSESDNPGLIMNLLFCQNCEFEPNQFASPFTILTLRPHVFLRPQHCTTVMTRSVYPLYILAPLAASCAVFTSGTWQSRAVIGGGWRHWDCTLCTCPGPAQL